MAVGSESDAGAVFLFSKDKGQVWKFSVPQGSSVRALNFTPNGKYIGAATFGGDAYIFGKEKGVPIISWKVNASLGGIDIADDGSFIAAGETDKKLYIFDRKTKSKTEISFDEYIEDIDISANGKYIAAGTGGSVYFFETYISQDRGKTFNCAKIIEPPAENQIIGEERPGEQITSSLCGDGKCEGSEAINNCRQDCGQSLQAVKSNLWEKIIEFFKNLFGEKNKSQKGEKQRDGLKKKFFKNEEGICGNDLCEPNLGESKKSCSQDCSA